MRLLPIHERMASSESSFRMSVEKNTETKATDKEVRNQVSTGLWSWRHRHRREGTKRTGRLLRPLAKRSPVHRIPTRFSENQSTRIHIRPARRGTSSHSRGTTVDVAVVESYGQRSITVVLWNATSPGCQLPVRNTFSSYSSLLLLLLQVLFPPLLLLLL